MYTSPARVSHATRVPACTQVRVGFAVVVEPEPLVVAETLVDADPVVDPEGATKRSEATTLPFRLVLVHGVL